MNDAFQLTNISFELGRNIFTYVVIDIETDDLRFSLDDRDAGFQIRRLDVR